MRFWRRKCSGIPVEYEKCQNRRVAFGKAERFEHQSAVAFDDAADRIALGSYRSLTMADFLSDLVARQPTTIYNEPDAIAPEFGWDFQRWPAWIDLPPSEQSQRQLST
jgi:hypothetical protein